MKKLAALLVSLLFAGAALAQADLKTVYLTGSSYLRPGTYPFVVGLTNIGTQSAAFRVYWQLDNGPVQSQLPSMPNVLPATGYTVPMRGDSFKFTFTTPGTIRLKIWVKPLFGVDPNPSNDTLTKIIKVMSNLPDKNVVLEVYKHQICGPCYPAAVFNHTNVEPLANHSLVHLYTDPRDSLYNADAETFNDLYWLAHPAAMFDRYKFPDAPSLEVKYFSTQTSYELEQFRVHDYYYEPLSVSITSMSLDTPTRLLKLRLKAKAFDTLSGDLRFNVWLTEDSLKFYQAEAPDPFNYWHRQVLRAFIGGIWGKQGSMPPSLSAGQEVSYDFQYTIPARYKLRHLTVIGMVQVYKADSSQRRIINSTRAKAMTKLGTDKVTTNLDVSIYPNPAGSELHLRLNTGVKPDGLQLSIADAGGKVLLQQEVRESSSVIDISRLPAGTYLLSVWGRDGCFAKPFVKAE